MTTKRENTLGRVHKLDKRKHEDRERRLMINAKAGRPIFVEQILKVHAMLPFTSDDNSTYNACVSELIQLGYKFDEKRACYRK